MTPDYKFFFEQKGIDYDQFSQNVSTHALDTADEMHNYVKLNESRLKRVKKTLKVKPEVEAFLKTYDKTVYIMVITENWCGDVSHNLPVIQALADIGGLQVRLVYRDEDTSLIDAHLTNGGRAIPKALFLDKDFNVVAEWGPRPNYIQQFIKTELAKPDAVKAEVLEEVQRIYNKDKSQTIQDEIVEILKKF